METKKHSISTLEKAVYVIIILIAVIAALVGMLVPAIKNNPAIQSLSLNLATEFAGVALIFFILRVFISDESGTESLLGKIAADTDLIKKSGNTQYLVNLETQMGSLKSSMDKFTGEFGKLNERIVTEFSEQQKELMRNLQMQFRQQIEESQAALEGAIIKELSAVIPASRGREQKIVSDTMVELLKHAIYTMAQFQSGVLEKEVQNTLGRASSKVTRSISEIGKDVKQVQAKVESLKLLLPAGNKGVAK